VISPSASSTRARTAPTSDAIAAILADLGERGGDPAGRPCGETGCKERVAVRAAKAA
jgi:hypothetical protein